MLSVSAFALLALSSSVQNSSETDCLLAGPGADKLSFSLVRKPDGGYLAKKQANVVWPFKSDVIELRNNGQDRYTSTVPNEKFVADLFVRPGSLTRVTVYRGRGRNEDNSIPVFSGVCSHSLNQNKSLLTSKLLQNDYLQPIKAGPECQMVVQSGNVARFKIYFEAGRANSGEVTLNIEPRDGNLWNSASSYRGLRIPMVASTNPTEWVVFGRDKVSESGVGVFRVNRETEGSASALIEFDNFRIDELRKQDGISAICSEWASPEGSNG